MNSLFFGGGLIGALGLGWIADVIGRKGALRVTAIIALIGAILSTASVNMAMWLISRFLSGFASVFPAHVAQLPLLIQYIVQGCVVQFRPCTMRKSHQQNIEAKWWDPMA